MQNVTLIKNKYSPYGGIQPYFKTEAALDEYIGTLPYYLLSLNDVNINFKENLEFDLKINLDINLVQDYNFVKVEYNNRIYYADIYDYSQISIGRTKIYCRRNVLYEVTDYLSIFENLYIDKATFNDYLKYTGDNSAINIGNYVAKNKIQDVNFTINGNTVKNILTYVIYYAKRTDPGYDYVSSIYGETTDYSIAFIPTMPGAYSMTNIVGQVYVRDEVDNTPSKINLFIKENSPYIFRIELLYLPYSIIDNHYRCIFYGNIVNYTNGLYYFSMFSTGENYNQPINKLKAVVGFENYSTDGELRFYQRENTFNINLDRFKCKKSGIISIQTFSIEGYFIPNIQGSSFLYYIYGNDNTLENNSNNSVIIVTSVNSTYIIDAKENFKAQNIYYDAMTENARNQKIAHGGINTAENISVGAMQLIAGGGMAAAGNFGGLGMSIAGGSNILRGVFEIAHAVNDTSTFDVERELFAKNEMAKPDSISVGNNAPVKFLEQNGKVLFIEKALTTISKAILKNKLENIGIDCNIYAKSINDILSDLTVNNKFFIKASNFNVASPVANSTLVELISLLKKGMRYYVYE